MESAHAKRKGFTAPLFVLAMGVATKITHCHSVQNEQTKYMDTPVKHHFVHCVSYRSSVDTASLKGHISSVIVLS